MNKKAMELETIGWLILAVIFLLIMTGVIMYLRGYQIGWLERIKDVLR